MIKKYLIQILPSIIIVSLFFVFIHVPNNKEAKQKIKELNLINKQLKERNDSIQVEIGKFQEDMVKSDEIIKTLMEEDFLLKEKVSTLNNKITNLKHKYEEANSHANNFDSSAIKQYFSNIE